MFKVGDIVTFSGKKGNWIIVKIKGSDITIRNEKSDEVVVSKKDIQKKSTTRSTMDYYESLIHSQEAYDKIISNARSSGNADQCVNRIDKIDAENVQYIKDNETSWLGTPIPKSFEDGMNRSTFQRMDDYLKVKKNVQELVNALIEKSFAELLAPSFVYNDLKIGTFDFARASINLLAVYKYYSIKLKKVVDFKEVEIYETDKDKFAYRLKRDKSEVLVIPDFGENVDQEKLKKFIKLLKKGENVFLAMANAEIQPGKYYSTINKCYLYKQDEPKPKNAIRLFVYIGGNCDKTGEELLYTGITAISIAQLLTALDYSVSIICVFGSVSDGICHFQSFPVKSFGEPIETETLLYVLSDPSYFRMKVFRNFCAVWIKYKEGCPGGLGRMADNSQVKDAIFKSYIKRDKHKNILYYTVGGVYNEDACLQAVKEIGDSVVNENTKARETMGLTAMPT